MKSSCHHRWLWLRWIVITTIIEWESKDGSSDASGHLGRCTRFTRWRQTAHARTYQSIHFFRHLFIFCLLFRLDSRWVFEGVDVLLDMRRLTAATDHTADASEWGLKKKQMNFVVQLYEFLPICPIFSVEGDLVQSIDVVVVVAAEEWTVHSNKGSESDELLWNRQMTNVHLMH